MSYYRIINTSYYHLRYNVYEPPGSPVEKETWIRFAHRVDESDISEHLETKHQNKVSLILCKQISLDEFGGVHSAIAAKN